MNQVQRVFEGGAYVRERERGGGGVGDARIERVREYSLEVPMST